MNALARASSHLRSLWPRGALWPVAPFVAYAAYSFARGDLRAEPLVVLGLVLGLAYASARTKEIFVLLYPLGLVFLLYDGMRPFQNVGLSASRVLVCELRDVEARLFGMNGDTVHDFWQAHPSPVLDLLCAVPYATFILWCAAFAIYLYFRDRERSRRFMWGFLVLNAAGFATYHLVPAAPPWYFHAHGCVVDLAAKPSEGPALARVDAMLGVAYFRGMYSQASSVFGALPSLHCAYPLLLVIEGWRAFGPKLRAVTIAYFCAMVFSAVYLDHHWILDALLGSAFAVATALLMRIASRSRGARPFAAATE